jgi:hypothetical protein
MNLTAEYFVRWRNYSENCRVLEYNRLTGLFIPTPYFDPHLERIVTDTEIAFLIDGDYLLFLHSNGMLETGRVSVQVAPNEFPRLEFCRQADSVAEILATVSRAAILRAPDFTEGEFDPSEDDCFNFFDAIQISRAGLVAARIHEIQLLVEEQGRYLETNDQKLIQARAYGAAGPPPGEVRLLVDSGSKYVSSEDAKPIEVKP